MSDLLQAGVLKEREIFEACERCLHRLCFLSQQFCSFTITRPAPKTPQKNNTHTTHIPGVCVARQQFVYSACFLLSVLLAWISLWDIAAFSCVLLPPEESKNPCSSITEFSSRKGDENNITKLFRLHLLCASRARSAGIATPTVLSACRHRISTINKTVKYDDDTQQLSFVTELGEEKAEDRRKGGDPSRNGSNGREGR